MRRALSNLALRDRCVTIIAGRSPPQHKKRNPQFNREYVDKSEESLTNVPRETLRYLHQLTLSVSKKDLI